MEKNVTCPHCKSEVIFKRNAKGRFVGTVVGGGIGYGLASGIGLAGAILGASVALPATAIGIGLFAIIGNRIGKEVDNSMPKCPKCKKKLVL